MRILVLGGTYFFGKAFVECACAEHEITILNRGTRKVEFSHPEHVREIIMDRHDLTENDLEGAYDVVADFCAYEKGDIRQVIRALDGRIGQYLFVSTCDVYARGTGQALDENAALETRDFGGQAGAYILGKVALEQELSECAAACGIAYTSVRPAFLYGPDNYAPREGIFFHWIDRAGQVPVPAGATGSFQMVYAPDGAALLLKLCNNERFFNRAVNLCGPQPESYESFCAALQEATGKEFELLEVSLEELSDGRLSLPFPLTKEESETYTSLYEDELRPQYRTLREGLRETYERQREDELFRKIDAYFDAGEPKEAERYMLRELERARAAGKDPLTLRVLNELIGYYRQTSQEEPLLQMISEALALAEREGSAGTISHATTALNAANAYRSLGKKELSQKYYKITEDIYKKKVREGSLHPKDMLLAGLYNNISLLYQEYRDYRSAKRYLNLALEIVKYHNAGFEIAVTYANLANTAVLAGQYQEAQEHAQTAIRLFQARGLFDPHYCAALSALATCHYEQGKVRRAMTIIEEAMQIVRETFGENSQYRRLQENLDLCRKRLANAPRNGMELSRRYYQTYGAPMIHEKFPEYEGKIAVGLAGEGSDCFGFDDEWSADHDYGPDFCMWLDEETYEAIGEALERAYQELPAEFEGYRRTVTSMGEGRRGVQKISDYYQKFLGTDQYEAIDFTQVEDASLAACVNGEVFRDDAGVFTGMRNRLLEGYPERVRLLKIAQDAAGFSQCGQYNYARCMQRGDVFTAGIMLSDCLRCAMKLLFHLQNVYPPHDKWLRTGAARLPGGREVTMLLDQISSKNLCGESPQEIEGVIEKLGALFAAKLYEGGEISDIDSYLDHHVQELLFKAQLADLSDRELVDRIAKLEFEAFDKVKNEGGRASCQNNWPTFSIMRKSQYLTWNREMLTQYLYDFTREYQKGHNLITEKYGRMMESTAPERYEEIKGYFPELPEEKKAVIEQIVRIQMEMVEALAQSHPGVVRNARSLHTYEDHPEDTSYETYLRGEISTYSDKMLQLYGKYVAQAAGRGENIAYQTMENTAKLYGYANLDEFEKQS